MSKITSMIVLLLALQFSLCSGQAIHRESGKGKARMTVFPQIHTNLRGLVREFVRSMYQDTKGNIWFGTNTDGIIRFDGTRLEEISLGADKQTISVREIVEDKAGNVWFGTSSGLVRYDGTTFTTFSTEVGLQHEEIWGLAVDASGVIWVGTIEGVSQFDGKTFKTVVLPTSMVEHPQHMLSSKLVLDIMEDRDRTIWLVTDGNGIFTYRNGEFTHLTKDNGLTDNSTADVFEDKQGNVWIGTFYGGVSRYDGTTYTNYTKDGVIEGVEVYNFCEDKRGNVWFSAEGHGVYRYDGTSFTKFTTADGLTTNVVQSILGDDKGQVWFGTWQGLCVYDGKTIMNANDKEPWTN